MGTSATEVGDKLHIITRRRFESEGRRHFAGEVTAISGHLHAVQGYAFVFVQGTNEYQRRPELRTRLFSLDQEGFIVNILPRDVVIATLTYSLVGKRLVLTDGGAFALDINEFGASR